MPAIAYLEVAVLPHYADWEIWSVPQRCAVEVPMPWAEWRPFIHPKAEASRMLKGFG
jgi:hypothetical protein